MIFLLQCDILIRMKKPWAFLCFFLVAVSVFAQQREDTIIYIPPVVSARSDHAAFFHPHFEMEVMAANYTLTNNINEANYVLRFESMPYIIVYDDGTSEPAGPGDAQYILQLTLINNEDNSEMLSISYPFTEVEECYEFSLTLVYSAMANVPLTKLTGSIEESDRWRNKWIYLRASFDYPVITTHVLKQDGLEHGGAIYNPDNKQLYNSLDHIVRAVPGATVGVELQFLHWMSTELGFLFRFGDPSGEYTFIPGIGLQLKFPIKPGRHFMLEPYAMLSTQANTSAFYNSFPWLAVGGGFQFGVRGGDMGAFFIDANFLLTVGDVVTKNNNEYFTAPPEVHWVRYAVSLGIGYKIGFFDRPPRRQRGAE